MDVEPLDPLAPRVRDNILAQDQNFACVDTDDHNQCNPEDLILERRSQTELAMLSRPGSRKADRCDFPPARVTTPDSGARQAGRGAQNPQSISLEGEEAWPEHRSTGW